MREQIIIAGSGGQGIQFAGQLLARAAVHQGLKATYVPNYGAERRGGPSFCFLVLADEPIYAQIFQDADFLLAFDQRARNQYGTAVKPSGTILVNADLAGLPTPGEQAKTMTFPASGQADAIRRGSGLNLVMLGAYAALSGRVRQDSLEWVLRNELTKKPEWLESNLAALRQGRAAFQKAVP